MSEFSIYLWQTFTPDLAGKNGKQTCKQIDHSQPQKVVQTCQPRRPGGTRALASQLYQGVRESHVVLITAPPSAERQVIPQLALKKARWPPDLKEPSQSLCWGRSGQMGKASQKQSSVEPRRGAKGTVLPSALWSHRLCAWQMNRTSRLQVAF